MQDGESRAAEPTDGAVSTPRTTIHPELLLENISQFQCHDETDEVFVLLSGECKLYVAEPPSGQPDRIDAIYCVDMQPQQIYNIRRGIYHSHTPSVDARVLIVENRDTDSTNSREITLTPEQREDLRAFSGRGSKDPR